MSGNLYLGLDFGTSGARAIVIDVHESIVAQAHCSYEITRWESWLEALSWLCASLPHFNRCDIAAIAIDGTSSTMLLTDEANIPLTEPLLYSDTRAQHEAQTIANLAPADHPAAVASSSLAKLYYLKPLAPHARYCADQAGWLASMLTGKPGITDYHNALKLGFDVAKLKWPTWMNSLDIDSLLPKVVIPGSALGRIAPEAAQRLDLPDRCVVRAGTTDSIAAFIASGAAEPGTGVTSLGSTLVLKLLSTQRVDAAQYGIYSHRFGKLWLAGGASNSGGAVLRQYFDDAQLKALSEQIAPSQDSGVKYYPLPKPGERFPVNDPELIPRLTPRPIDDVRFLHGLLEGMARIEARGYALLAELGATPLTHVLSAGGGAQNESWTAIRSRLLGVPVSPAQHGEAAYGAARLARHGAKLLS